MKKALVLLVSAALLALVALASRQYLSGPRRVVEKWLACHSADDRSLVTATDSTILGGGSSRLRG